MSWLDIVNSATLVKRTVQKILTLRYRWENYHCLTNHLSVLQWTLLVRLSLVLIENLALYCRYPEAIALPGIETEHVMEALVEMFSGVGILDERLRESVYC